MSKRRNSDGRDHCARLEEDDGLDPKLDELRERAQARLEARERPNHRDAQLAKVAARLIERDLCSMGPAIACGLGVVHVEVIGAGSHLRVRVAASAPVRDPEALSRWLATVTPTVRASLARALARKRVPTLTLMRVDLPARFTASDAIDEGNES